MALIRNPCFFEECGYTTQALTEKGARRSLIHHVDYYHLAPLHRQLDNALGARRRAAIVAKSKAKKVKVAKAT